MHGRRQNRGKGRLLARVTMLGLAVLLAACLASGASVNLAYERIMGFGVRYVTVDTTDREVVVAVAAARNFPNGLERWSSFVDRLQPDAAINGTYFSLADNLPVGDVATEGKLVYRGAVGTALCIEPDNRVTMRPGPRQETSDWSGCSTVLCAGPRLLTDGVADINARAEGFRDPRVLGSAPRSAVAHRADGTLILLTIEEDISLENLALVCKKLGARDAMCLDGGSSSALYADGRTVTRPGRSLSNILVVYTNRWRYQRYANDLLPAGLPVLKSLLREPARPAWSLTTPKAPPMPPAQVLIPRVMGGYTAEPARPAPGPSVAPLVRAVRPLMRAMPEVDDAVRAPRVGAPPVCLAVMSPHAGDAGDVPAGRVRVAVCLPESLDGGAIRATVPTLAPAAPRDGAFVRCVSALPNRPSAHAVRPTGGGGLAPMPAVLALPVVAPPLGVQTPRMSALALDLPTPMPRPDLCVFQGGQPTDCGATALRWVPQVGIAPRATPESLADAGVMLRLLAPDSPARGACRVGVEIVDPSVRRVVLRINGVVRVTLTGSGGYTWDTTREAEGPALLEAVAWSADGTKLATDTARVTIAR